MNINPSSTGKPCPYAPAIGVLTEANKLLDAKLKKDPNATLTEIDFNTAAKNYNSIFSFFSFSSEKYQKSPYNLMLQTDRNETGNFYDPNRGKDQNDIATVDGQRKSVGGEPKITKDELNAFMKTLKSKCN